MIMIAPASARQAAVESLQRADSLACSGHEAFIRSLVGLACAKPAPCECAHLGPRGNHGTGLTLAGRYLVPLCRPATVWSDCCHSRMHYLGRRGFWSELFDARASARLASPWPAGRLHAKYEQSSRRAGLRTIASPVRSGPGLLGDFFKTML